MLFFTGGPATGNTLAVNVFGRPEMTTNQSLTKTYRGCKKPLLTAYPHPHSAPSTPPGGPASGGAEKFADPTERRFAGILQHIVARLREKKLLGGRETTAEALQEGLVETEVPQAPAEQHGLALESGQRGLDGR